MLVDTTLDNDYRTPKFSIPGDLTLLLEGGGGVLMKNRFIGQDYGSQVMKLKNPKTNIIRTGRAVVVSMYKLCSEC